MDTRILHGYLRGKAHIAVLAVLLVAVAHLAMAQNVTIRVVQHDCTLDRPSELTRYFEEKLLDGFFDVGAIVSNENIALSDSKPISDKVFKDSVKEATVGHALYFALVDLYYKAGNKDSRGYNPDAIVLSYIQGAKWTLVATKSGTVIQKGDVAVGAVPKAQDSGIGIESFAHKVAQAIYQAIRK